MDRSHAPTSVSESPATWSDIVRRFVSILLASGFLIAPAWAQDSESEEAETEGTELEVEDAAAEEFDDSDLDDQVYTDADDDFRPSEEIPADQSIAFPSDI